MAIITISEKCNGCGTCVKVCPQMILAVTEDKKMVVEDPGRCMSCYGCEDVCPRDAVFNKKALLPDTRLEDIETEQTRPIEEEYDVIVVGAGPSGLGVAISCAREGLNTAVFERLPNRRVSHHTDGGVLFVFPGTATIKREGGVFELPEHNFKMTDGFIHSEMEWLTLDGPGGYRFDDRFLKGMTGYCCSKDKFVHQLADEAERHGAKLYYDTRVKTVKREGERITGVILLDGTEVRSNVVVTADGVLARLSKKTKIILNSKSDAHVQYVTLEYKRPEGLKSGFSFMMGDLPFEDDTVKALPCVGIGNHVEVSMILHSKTKFYTLNKPIDYWVKKIAKTDKRVKKYLGDHLDSLELVAVKGTRLRLRELSRDNAVDGAVAVGDNWVAGAQLGNVSSLANGLFAGKELKKAFERNDFSKGSLSSVSDFITKDMVKTIKQTEKSMLYPVVMDNQTLLKYFEIFSSANYPTFFYGTKMQISMMMMGIMAKNIFKLLAYPKIFKYL